MSLSLNEGGNKKRSSERGGDGDGGDARMTRNRKKEKEEVGLVLYGIVQYNNTKKLLYLTNPFRFD